jgi:hypothetical protein
VSEERSRYYTGFNTERIRKSSKKKRGKGENCENWGKMID